MRALAQRMGRPLERPLRASHHRDEGRMSAPEQWLTEKDLIARSKLSRTTLYKLRVKGLGPKPVPVALAGPGLRYRESEVQAWLANPPKKRRGRPRGSGKAKKRHLAAQNDKAPGSAGDRPGA